MDKHYTSVVAERAPRPRSKRLREAGVAGSSSSSSSTPIGDFLTEAEANDLFITKSFFNQLFKVHVGDDTDYTNMLLPNSNEDENTTYTIEAMHGLWSRNFLSALGKNEESGGSGGGAGYIRIDSSTILDPDENGIIDMSSYAAEWDAKADKTTTLAGYGITDAKIANGTITLGSNSITPLTASSSLAWAKLTGTPDTLSGYGIKDAKIANGVITLGSNTITPVTSVGLSAPTGFSVSGSPVTKTGTLAFAYATGYEGFTTALKNKIEEIYSWFEEDANGDIKTKDTAGGHVRGLYSESFVSALGKNEEGSSGGSGTVTAIKVETNAFAPQDENGIVDMTNYVLTSAQKQSLLDAAHTHSNKSVLDGITSAKVTAWDNVAKIMDDDSDAIINKWDEIIDFLDGIPDQSSLADILAAKANTSTTVTNVAYASKKLTKTINGTTTDIVTASTLFSDGLPTNTTKNYVLAAPSNAAGTPTFRALVAADIPDISATYATASRATTLEGYFNSGGVAKVAAKLNTGTTTYSAWGQTYWSSGVPQSISGNMTSVGSITPSANGNALGTTSARFNIYGTAGNFSGNVSVGGTLGVTGATTLSSTLSVANAITLSGTTAATRRIYFGDTSHYIELTSTGFHFSHGIYSDSFASALGANSSGGGGGTGTVTGISLGGGTAIGPDETTGIVPIPAASTSAYGVIKVGSTLAISSGVLNQKASGVTAGTYRSVTVDTYGRVTAGTNPTTLSGYGISDAYTKTQVDNTLGGYLPLTGGTLTGTLTVPKIRINTRHSSGDTSGGIYYYNGTTDYLLIGQGSANLWIGANETDGTHHTGSIFISAGSGSAYISRLVNNARNNYIILDAGNYSSYALPLSGGQMTGALTWKDGTALPSTTSTSYVLCIDTFADGGTTHYITTANLSVGSATKATQDGSGNTITSTYLPLSGGTMSGTLKWVSAALPQTTSPSYLLTIDSFTDGGTTKWALLSDVLVGKATTLATPRTIWGQSFDGSSNVSGSMTGVGSITANGDYVSTRTNNTATNVTAANSVGSIGIRAANENRGLVDVTNNVWVVGTNGTNTWLSQGKVGIGTTSPDTRLHVVGGGGKFTTSAGTDGIIVAGSSLNGEANYGAIDRLHQGDALYLQFTNTGNLIMCMGGGNVGIGTSSPSSKLHVTGNILASGEVTASSDIRLKTIVGDGNLDINYIANAPNILFKWNNGQDDKVHGGSVAQYFLEGAKHFVLGNDKDFYSLNYGALATSMAISIAKEVVKHEDEITRLKKEVVKLRERVAELEERRV